MGSAVCYEYTPDNVTWNSPFADRNSSQTSIRVTKGSKVCCDLEMGEMREMMQTPPSTGHAQNEAIESLCATNVEVVALGDSRGETLGSRHEYEELELKDLTQGTSTPKREHDYEDPDIDMQEPANRVTTACGYEEPIVSGWKRLSMPSLDSISPASITHMPRRNSSASQLLIKCESRTEKQLQAKKPAKILHYAEFSLYPSQNQVTQHLTTASSHWNTGSALPKEPHDYEEPSFGTVDRHHPLCLGPIPAPIRLLRSASDYEVPLTIPTEKSSRNSKSKSSQSVMYQVKLKLNQLSHNMNGNFKDEEAEKLINVESDTAPDQLKSPGSDMLLENKNCLLQEAKVNNVSYRLLL